MTKIRPRLASRSNCLFLFSVVCLLTLLTGCLRYVPSRSEIAAQQESKGAPVAEYAGEEAFFSLDRIQEQRLMSLIRARNTDRGPLHGPTYRIGVGDVLQVAVFDVEELNRKSRVRPDGQISLPLLGVVPAAGKTEEELQEELANRLEKFMYDPQVQVYIEEYTAHKVWVIGEIHRPGAYPLSRDNYTLIELLSEAGGRTERAGSLVVIIPVGTMQENQPRRARLDNPRLDIPLGAEFDTPVTPPSPTATRHGIEIPFDSLVGSVDATPIDVPLKPGDTIVVSEVGKVQVDGEVNNPGSFELSARMTLLGAIAAAQGLNYSANVQEVEVLRELGAGKKALITVDLEKIALYDGNDIRLRNGDLVRVPSARGRFVTRQTINVLNGIFGRVNPF